MPCFGATIDDIDIAYIKSEYLPQVIDSDVLLSDNRGVKEQLAAIHLFELIHDCPTNAAMILFGKNLQYFEMAIASNSYVKSKKAIDAFNYPTQKISINFGVLVKSKFSTNNFKKIRIPQFSETRFGSFVGLFLCFDVYKQ